MFSALRTVFCAPFFSPKAVQPARGSPPAVKRAAASPRGSLLFEPQFLCLTGPLLHDCTRGNTVNIHETEHALVYCAVREYGDRHASQTVVRAYSHNGKLLLSMLNKHEQLLSKLESLGVTVGLRTGDSREDALAALDAAATRVRVVEGVGKVQAYCWKSLRWEAGWYPARDTGIVWRGKNLLQYEDGSREWVALDRDERTLHLGEEPPSHVPDGAEDDTVLMTTFCHEPAAKRKAAGDAPRVPAPKKRGADGISSKKRMRDGDGVAAVKRLREKDGTGEAPDVLEPTCTSEVLGAGDNVPVGILMSEEERSNVPVAKVVELSPTLAMEALIHSCTLATQNNKKLENWAYAKDEHRKKVLEMKEFKNSKAYKQIDERKRALAAGVKAAKAAVDAQR